MSDDKSTDIISKNQEWAQEAAKIRSTEKTRTKQISFDFDLDVDTALRLVAARRHLTPSAIVRERLDLPIAEPTRKRISLSFTDIELSELAARYNLDSIDTTQIKSFISKEIQGAFNNTGDAEDGLGRKKDELARAENALNLVKDEMNSLQNAAIKISLNIESLCKKGQAKP